MKKEKNGFVIKRNAVKVPKGYSGHFRFSKLQIIMKNEGERSDETIRENRLEDCNVKYISKFI